MKQARIPPIVSFIGMSPRSHLEVSVMLLLNFGCFTPLTKYSWLVHIKFCIILSVIGVLYLQFKIISPSNCLLIP